MEGKRWTEMGDRFVGPAFVLRLKLRPILAELIAHRPKMDSELRYAHSDRYWNIFAPPSFPSLPPRSGTQDGRLRVRRENGDGEGKHSFTNSLDCHRRL